MAADYRSADVLIADNWALRITVHFEGPPRTILMQTGHGLGPSWEPVSSQVAFPYQSLVSVVTALVALVDDGAGTGSSKNGGPPS